MADPRCTDLLHGDFPEHTPHEQMESSDESSDNEAIERSSEDTDDRLNTARRNSQENEDLREPLISVWTQETYRAMEILFHETVRHCRSLRESLAVVKNVWKGGQAVEEAAAASTDIARATGSPTMVAAQPAGVEETMDIRGTRPSLPQEWRGALQRYTPLRTILSS